MKLKSLIIATLALSTMALGTTAHARGAVGPAYNGNSGYVCTYEGSNVMLRSGAGQKYKVLARMPSGSDVRILDARDVGNWTWYKVKFGRTTGWARSDYICS